MKRAISKKTDKPYCTATVEDMTGQVTVLCVGDNYEKFNEQFELNKPLMVIGEVNNSEDVPKIFPVDVFPLDHAPAKFTKQVHLRIKTEAIAPDAMDGVRELAEAHPGKTPLLLCLRQPGGESVFVEADERFNVTPGLALAADANERFGDATYYPKVDPTLPEPQRRRYAKKNNGDAQ